MITAKNTQTTFDLTPAGNHVARCYSMIEIGTVEENFKGEPKTLHKVRISWELPSETKVFNTEKGEQPYSISKEYTLSMHEKSNLRRDLQAWRGKAFTEDEANAFDITKLLGQPCMVNVVHEASKNGNTYANVSGITPLPKGFVCPPAVNPVFVLSYDEFDFNKFDKLPEFIRNKMIVTPEFKRVSNPKKEDNVKVLPKGDDLPF